jgi:hypothetical protein
MAPGLPRTPPRDSLRRSSRGSLQEPEESDSSSSQEDTTSRLGSQKGRQVELEPARGIMQGNLTEMGFHAKLAEPRLEWMPPIPLTLSFTGNHGAKPVADARELTEALTYSPEPDTMN